MHKTIYIDIDEEITSVIDRIRREGAPDIFLVVPKSALLCQGLLNLKLLKREAERLNKNIMMVTNDKYAKKVIERAGLTLSNKPISEPEEPRTSKTKPSLPQLAAEETVKHVAGDDYVPPKELVAEKPEREIGSNSFFATPPEKEDDIMLPLLEAKLAEVKPQQPSRPSYLSRILKKDDSFNKDSQSSETMADPKPSLRSSIDVISPRTAPIPAKPAPPAMPPANSVVAYMPKTPPDKPQEKPIRATVDMHKFDVQKKISVEDKNPQVRDGSGHKIEKDNPVPVHSGLPITGAWKSKEAEEFFSDYNKPVPLPQQEKEAADYIEPQPEKRESSSRGHWKLIGFIALIALIFAGAAGWTYWKYPLVKITVYPKHKVVDLPMDVKVKVGGSLDLAAAQIPGKQETIEITSVQEVEATGEKFTSDSGKARGKVTIKNRFSSSPQTLVATTRVLSKDKKLFRLVEQVTVPGMKGDEPGEVEATVVADEPGDEYNIGPSTFTIEGFKGSPKYDKFEVTSSTAMTGGSGGTGNNKVKVVTTKDIENSRQKALDKMDSTLEAEVSSKISFGSTAMIDTAEKEIAKSAASHKEGEVAEQVAYTIVQNVKIITFSAEDVKKVVADKINNAKESGYELKSSSDVRYIRANVNKEKNELLLQISSQSQYMPVIDINNIKKGIVGKGENDMKMFLANYEEIDRVEIKFTPAWLNSVPVVERKIQVQIAQ